MAQLIEGLAVTRQRYDPISCSARCTVAAPTPVAIVVLQMPLPELSSPRFGSGLDL
jgi:hypothetical protein